jgi:molybdopterin-guanine dinucleotide biosynthesis protein B
MKVFSLVGWSGSGKTTVIAGLISNFKARGKVVVAVKNVPNEYGFQPEGKDSFKFLEAGADQVVLCSKGEIILMKRKKGQENILGMIQSVLSGVDLILLEGLVLKNVPVIQVLGSCQENGFKFPIEKCSAIVSEKDVRTTIPRFKKNDILGLAQFMEAYKNE